MSRLSRHVRSIRDRLVGKSAVARSAVLKRLSDDGLLVLVDCGDHILAVDPADRIIARTIMETKNWQRPDFDLVLATMARLEIAPRPCFVDVGANIGMQTIYALKSGAFSRAIAIEPEESNFRLLQLNLRINGLDDRVVAINAAASEGDGLASLRRHPTNHGAHSLGLGEGATVRTVSLGSVLAGEHESVGLIWIDAEGHEREVLAGVPTPHPCPVVVEYNRHLYGEEGTAAFAASLARHYRSFVALRGEAAGELPLSRLSDAAPGDDVLLLPS